MTGYLQRLLDAAAPSAAATPALTPVVRSDSPVFAADQLLGLEGFESVAAAAPASRPDHRAETRPAVTASRAAAGRQAAARPDPPTPAAAAIPEAATAAVSARVPPPPLPTPDPPRRAEGTFEVTTVRGEAAPAGDSPARPVAAVPAPHAVEPAVAAAPSGNSVLSTAAPVPAEASPRPQEPPRRSGQSHRVPLDVADPAAPLPGPRTAPVADMAAVADAQPAATTAGTPGPLPDSLRDRGPAMAVTPRPRPLPPAGPGLEPRAPRPPRAVPAAPQVSIGRVTVEVMPEPREEPASPAVPVSAESASVIGPLGNLRASRRVFALGRS